MTADGMSIADHFAVVREGDCTTSVLGVVGSKYHPIQNSELFGLPQDLVDAGLVSYETAGSLFHGQVVFALAKLQDIEIVRKYSGTLDTVEQFLLWTSRHDGNGGTIGGTTRVRVVCKNTLDCATATGLGDRVSVAHRSQGSKHLQVAHAFFAERIKASAKAQDTMQELADTPLSVGTFKEVASEFFTATRSAVVKSDNGKAKREAAIKELIMFFGEGTGNTGETKWDGYNAITEFIDHSKARYENAKAHAASAFMQSTLMGENFRKKGKALQLLRKA
ncbi:hypothetical protein LCGC14_2847980 [marine sediment metagenome]|uniref:DUF932 domain-containing protein n=1 Tax=marine sediment metagenome TaxID=412755 RepID=A0A0F8Y9C2_9ZZZZ